MWTDRDRSAQNEALMALDFVSLLLSKDLPTQAESTMSPFLKQQVKSGTLGIDMWQNMQPDEGVEKENETIAKGWRIETLQQSATSLLTAATRLETSVRRETEYWNQVLSVSERGWSICRMPLDQHNLGVRYGFSEARGQFAHRGLAALRAGDGGQVVLDKGFGDSPRALRVHIRNGDQVAGSSRVAEIQDQDEVTLEARIRQARDSLYEEELFQEMIEEARILNPHGVRIKHGGIVLPLPVPEEGPAGSLLLELVPLHGHKAETEESLTDNPLPEAMALAFRLLLSNIHRQRLSQRSRIPQPLSIKAAKPNAASILRPVLTALQHAHAVKTVNALLEKTASILKAASIDSRTRLASLGVVANASTDTMEALMSTIVSPAQASASMTLAISPEIESTITLDVRTEVSPSSTGSTYKVTAPIERGELECSRIEDVTEFISDSLALLLVREIARRYPSWVLDDETATLFKPSASGSTEADLSVIFSGDSLSLHHGAETTAWTIDGKSDVTFWEKVDNMLSN